MSLRAHTYTATTSPPFLGKPFRFSPSPPSPNLAEKKHQAQLAAYKRDPTRAAAAIRHAALHPPASWSGAGQGRRLDSVLEEGINDDKLGKRRRRSSLDEFVDKGKKWGRRAKYLLYALGLYCFYVAIVQPYLAAEADDYASRTNTSAPSHITSARVHRRQMGHHQSSSSLPRAPLPPALYSQRSANHSIQNGYLKVDPQSTVHPIYQLIRDARAEWDEKVRRQSKTLKEAVEEYKRRYKRMPPKGFDKWWAYVCENNIPLPDEYDQIYHDILPFRALSPRDLSARSYAASQLPDTYVLRVKRGSIRTKALYSHEAIHGADERLEQQADLLRPIAKYLPDLEVVWSVHDTPRTVLGHDHRRELLEHVEEDEWLDADDEIDLTLRGWAAACPPRSAIKTHDSDVVPPSLPDTSLDQKTFISSHRTTMDICSHPDLVPLHGVLAGKNPQVESLTPIFTLSKTGLHADILGVPVEQWVDDIKDVPWDEKKFDQLLWRGSNTGIYHSTDTPWRGSHRTRLLKLANHQHEEDYAETEHIQVLPPPRGMKSGTAQKGMQSLKLADLNDRFMDLAFTGLPIQCSIEDGTCDELSREFAWSDTMSHEDALDYKYIIDVDGNAWSARFKRLLAAGSLVFKATIMPEWWTDRIQPWVHYVPIQMDYSDLYDTMVFFQGDPHSHSHGEPALARDIARAGQEWSKTSWRKEDMIAYMFRLYLEWGRLLAPKRSSMDFVYKEEMEMKREE
ncbi:hypothetical protein I316_03961 [Kwoniella heveanensis BCC8398]|uniref:Glycosyl transferase CAP10 domain-containing protein n=1 Tax=Kwoniella heveanensis BCC8398 TaxID=1296120 RepID=A0A1B9GTV3_9TREE|nr:hypothetical protein I316_03961 [Kwoniella heveanensis BCC8398]